MEKSTKSYLIFLIIFLTFNFSSCDKNPGESNGNNLKFSKPTIKYIDSNNQYRKSHIPVLINYEHDNEIITGTPVNVRITVQVLKDFKDVNIQIKLHPLLKYVSGDTRKELENFNKGGTSNLEIIIIPLRRDKYKIYIHFSGKYNGQRVGVSSVIKFSEAGYKKRNPHEKENYKRISPDKGYTQSQNVKPVVAFLKF